MTVTLADGTRRTELWRLMTSLLDAERYPAHELILAEASAARRAPVAPRCVPSLNALI
jgi:hypothetical protein